MTEEKETKTAPATEEKREEAERKEEEAKPGEEKVEEKTEEKATEEKEGIEKKPETEKVEEKPEDKKEPEGEEKTPVQKEEEKPKEKEEKEKPVEVPEKLKKIVEAIENLKVADLAELVKILEKKFGVSAVPAVPVSGAGAPATAPTAGAEEKKFFNVLLTAIGEKKIEVIKAVRDITQRGLKESKDLVDKVAEGPQIVKENVKKEEAEEIKKKLEEAGATVEVK